MVITKTQLKAINLIFLEHDKYKQEIELKDVIISEQDSVINRMEQITSIRENELSAAQNEITKLNTNLTKSKKKLKRLRNLTISGFGLAVCLIPFIFINH